MAFAGVAVVLDAANPIVGPRPADHFPLAYRGDGPPVTFHAGDQFLTGFTPYTPEEFDDASVVEAFFTIEHLSGSATIRLHAGWDPDFDVTNAALATASMGDHLLAGDGITAVQVPIFDLARFVSYDDELVVLVEVLTGSIEVRQIRLRVWPPGGPAGAWVTMPGFEHEYATALRSVELDAPPGGYLGSGFIEGTTAGAYDAAAAALVARDKVPMVTEVWTGAQTYTISLLAKLGVGLDSITPTYNGSYQHIRTAQRVLVNVATPARFVLNSAAIVRPPDVVEDIDVDWVEPIGTPSLTGIRVEGVVSNAPGHEGPDSFLTWSTVDADDLVGAPYPTAFAAPAPPGDLDVVLPVSGFGDGLAVLLGFGNPFLTGPPPYGGPSHVNAIEGYETGPNNSLYMPGGAAFVVLQMPSYRTWDPTATPVVVDPPLRQVQRDDNANGFTAARWGGGSSRQSSNRWIGYL